MKDRLISTLANIAVAAALAFASLGIASISDSIYAKSWELFSVIFVVGLGATLVLTKK